MLAAHRANTRKPSLRPGLCRTNRITIDRERTISFMGEEARTYSTPSMDPRHRAYLP